MEKLQRHFQKVEFTIEWSCCTPTTRVLFDTLEAFPYNDNKNKQQWKNATHGLDFISLLITFHLNSMELKWQEAKGLILKTSLIDPKRPFMPQKAPKDPYKLQQAKKSPNRPKKALIGPKKPQQAPKDHIKT